MALHDELEAIEDNLLLRLKFKRLRLFSFKHRSLRLWRVSAREIFAAPP